MTATRERGGDDLVGLMSPADTGLGGDFRGIPNQPGEAAGETQPRMGYESQSSPTRHPQDELDDQPIYRKVHVLILTFAFHNLGDQLDLETEKVAETFLALDYSVEKFEIPMNEPLNPLKSKLGHFLDLAEDETRETLAIVYYHGHGGLSKSKRSLVFSSHSYPDKDDVEELQIHLRRLWNDLDDINVSRKTMRQNIELFQPVAEVSWRDISSTIINAKCDTLIILDCCEAGLSTVRALSGDAVENEQDEATWLPFRKELIGACTWNNSTQDRMSEEMCNALETLLLDEAHLDARISCNTLIREMNNKLARHFLEEHEDEEEEDEHVAQAIHFLLRRTGRDDRILLENLKQYNLPHNVSNSYSF